MSGYNLIPSRGSCFDERHVRRASCARWFAGILLLIVLLWPARAAKPEINAYMGKTGPSTLLNREQLLEIFFIRKTKWLNGGPIRIFTLPDQHPMHIRFVKKVLGVYPYQLRSAWDRMLYSGTGVPPSVVNTIDEMRQRVDKTPGAIGYLEQ